MSESTPPATPPAEGEKVSKGAAIKAALSSKLTGLTSGLTGGLKGAAGKINPKEAVVGGLKGLLKLPTILFQGDLTSKLLALGLLAGIAMAGYATWRLYDIFLAKHFVAKPVSKEKTVAGEGVNEFLKEAGKLKVLDESIIFLEKFSTNLVSPSGVYKQFELELYAETDTPATAKWVTANIIKLREVLAAAVQQRKYSDFMETEGREVLKAELLKETNTFLHKNHVEGKVKRIYISHFVMGD